MYNINNTEYIDLSEFDEVKFKNKRVRQIIRIAGALIEIYYYTEDMIDIQFLDRLGALHYYKDVNALLIKYLKNYIDSENIFFITVHENNLIEVLNIIKTFEESKIFL